MIGINGRAAVVAGAVAAGPAVGGGEYDEHHERHAGAYHTGVGEDPAEAGEHAAGDEQRQTAAQCHEEHDPCP
ncbi:hypothetical protein KC220_21285, partial [Mycobacterium tuberculosis]|nr:hypothetical protein [Mycobacterium tuberculosis]